MPSLRSFLHSIPASLAAAMLLLGCNPKGNNNSRILELESEVAALRSKVASLDTRLMLLEKEVGINEDMLTAYKNLKELEGVAYLTPDSTGYSVIRMDLGNLTVSLADVSPYANGSKVTLRFGNLTSATIEGLNATIEWGPVDQEGSPISGKINSKGFDATEPLNPGSWYSAAIVLEGIQPSLLGFVRIRGVGHRAIRMMGK